MTKSFIEEVREYVDSAINPFGNGQAFAEALIAIDDILKLKHGVESDAGCLLRINRILEGEQK